ncbi:MAG: RNase adapter RapZ [Acidiferrobacterales bacterium]|jgi:UPF0042 nucleotide-binding protein|nr:RNase adapter RapZ [Acidiferrobacterales bacterium]
MSLLIISGLSGSGKSITLHALEDSGFYCIDNLPAKLLPHLAEQLKESADTPVTRVAVGIDARNRTFLGELPDALRKLSELGVDYEIVFLEADDSILIKRYKETRRKHPLTDEDVSLLEGIALEKKRLNPLSSKATLRIDTTYTTPHQLRQQVREFALRPGTGALTLLFRSFGFKHGTPMDADYVFDVRCLPNPYWQPELRMHTGLDEPVIDFLQRQDAVDEMFQAISSFLEKWLPAFEQEHRTYLTIAVGCTGGQHRSVYLTERLARYFAAKNVQTQVRHRELT